MPLASASRIGAYEIRSFIGAGGMGEVYRATDSRLKRDVAIKVLPPEFTKDAEHMRRFEFEAQAAGRLNHPNVLSVYDLGVHEGSPYLVSELLEGESLRARLRGGKVPPARALDYARQIASGLAAAHAAGIVHRDLKPENLFIMKDGRVKILDFGLAKQSEAVRADDSDETRTLPGTVLGTVPYMSPEQIRGQNVDCRSDIFSFGCVLHEMLSGAPPFQGASSVETMNATLTQERPELNTSSGVAQSLDRIIGHCLEKDPDVRFQSARDLAFDLASISEVSQAPRGLGRGAPPWRRRTLGVALLLVAAAAGAFVLGRISAPDTRPAFQRLTFRRGTIEAARFAPDRQTIVYSAAWEDEPIDVFTVRLESPESRSLGFRDAGLFGISRSGELALALNQRIGSSPFMYPGVLALVPFSGGSPRSTEDRITAADWTPDGRELSIVRQTDSGAQLEFPPGKVLYRSPGFISNPRISRDGESIAFLDHGLAFDNSGSVALVDRSGRKEVLTSRFNTADGLAWSSTGREIWFSGSASGAKQNLWAVTRGGRVRMVYGQSGSVALQDIAPDGRVLLANMQWRQAMTFRGPSDTRERELSWLDWSLPTGISPDGKLIVFSETGEGGGEGGTLYLRETNGAPAVKLGRGAFATFSPDGKWVISTDPDGSDIVIYPVGTGTTRRIPIKGFTIAMAGMLRDGRRIWFDGNPPSQGRRLYLTSVDGEPPRPIILEEAQAVPPYVVDGENVVATVEGRLMVVPLEGGKPVVLPGVEPGERITGWAPDGSSFFTFLRSEVPAKVYRVERASGRRTFFKEIGPGERAGIGHTGLNVLITPDGKSYVYVTIRNLSELFVVTGLK
jgi:Tol biopolymer transport system component